MIEVVKFEQDSDEDFNIEHDQPEVKLFHLTKCTFYIIFTARYFNNLPISIEHRRQQF